MGNCPRGYRRFSLLDGFTSGARIGLRISPRAITLARRLGGFFSILRTNRRRLAPAILRYPGIMTVELKPETERLVQEEIQKGRVHSVDELIVRGVRAIREGPTAAPREPRQNLADFLMQSPFAGAELVIERQKDHDRPVDL